MTVCLYLHCLVSVCFQRRSTPSHGLSGAGKTTFRCDWMSVQGW